MKSNVHKNLVGDASQPLWAKASQAAREARAHVTATQEFVLSWRSGGMAKVVGYHALKQAVGLQITSIRVLLSKGRGYFDLERQNPLTGELDVLTVARLSPPKPKAKRGRPPKASKADWARLGSDAAENPGSVLAEERKLARHAKAQSPVKSRKR